MKSVENTYYTYKRTLVIPKSFFLFFCFALSFSFNVFSQDSIPIAKDLTEKNDLEFQNFFFNALTQKSIGNYQKAIESLEDCNQILPNNSTVFFEFSKNYLQLNKTFLAKEYIHKAIAEEKDNIWMLMHLVEILKKERNFSEAIAIQKKVVLLDSNRKDELIRLYVQNKDYKTALSVLEDLDDQQILPNNLRSLKENLENRNKPRKKAVTKKNSEKDLLAQFSSERKYETLEQIFKEYKDEPAVLLEYSKKGMALFPAQPYVYLINANTLIEQEKFDEAATVLENGIDFVIEDKMESNFYKSFIEAYKGLRNSVKEEEYKIKLKKLKS
ncbi:hypothetical protein N9V96_01445 [Polaribacter sp.]|nr:hypothetical protein [Polaribacter sp.]